MLSKALFTSNSDEWETPQELYEELNKEFNFQIDVCASEQNHKCKKYFTKEKDGLSKKWGGTLYFVTPHIHKLINGLKKHSEKRERIIQSLLCLSRREPTRSIFTISFTNGLKFDLLKDVYTSIIQKDPHLFRQCL